jgi:hypothetical protein
MKILIFIFVLSTYFKQEPPKSWKGKEVTYKQYRDSLRVSYFKYCDSIKKVETKKIK